MLSILCFYLLCLLMFQSFLKEQSFVWPSAQQVKKARDFSQIKISQNCGYSPNSQMHTWNSLQPISFSCSLSLTILHHLYLRDYFITVEKNNFTGPPRELRYFHLESSKDLLLINFPKFFFSDVHSGQRPKKKEKENIVVMQRCKFIS